MSVTLEANHPLAPHPQNHPRRASSWLPFLVSPPAGPEDPHRRHLAPCCSCSRKARPSRAERGAGRGAARSCCSSGRCLETQTDTLGEPKGRPASQSCLPHPTDGPFLGRHSWPLKSGSSGGARSAGVLRPCGHHDLARSSPAAGTGGGLCRAGR